MVFPEKAFQAVDMFEDEKKDTEVQDTTKVYKIKFEINLLASIGEHKIEDPDKKGHYLFMNKGTSLMALAGDSDEMPVFDSEHFNILI